MTDTNDFSGQTPTWCPGCGDWGIGVAIKQALVELGHTPSNVGVVFDIGCSGNMNDFLNAYAMHALHGRSIPNAIGMKIANPEMPVIVVGGDGGIYGEGGNHFLHACRGNHDITVLVHDNSVYGLTTGQVAPTAQKGMKSRSTPGGIIEVSVNPLSLAVTQGATFVANTFAGNVKHIIETIKSGIQHKGFSLINVLQPCVTFNKVNTYQYYMKNSYSVGQDHDKTNLQQALSMALEMNEDKFPLGILYQIRRDVYHEKASADPLIKKEPFEDFGSLLQEFV